jgi:cation diffusion facilitator family transporter
VLFFNIGVALIKLIIGKFTNCASMVADGFHSCADSGSTILGLIGISLAGQPPDKDHPYGHEKFETIAAFGIVLFLFLACVSIVKDALQRFREPVVPSVTALSFVVMAVTLGINFFVMRYEKKMGQAHASEILVCDALHTQSDIFVSLSVIATLVAIRIGYPFLDVVVSLGIALFIAKAGWSIFKDTSRTLSDARAIDTRMVEKIVRGMEGVKSCHMIRSRGSKNNIYIDLHIEFDPNLTVSQAHAINEAITSRIMSSIHGVQEVLINTEPYKK